MPERTECDSAAAERAWIGRVVALDDQQAFTQLVRLHQSAIRQFLRRLTGDAGRADELAQDTFLKAYRHLASYRGSGRFLSWLFKIAWQLFASRQRGAGWHIEAVELGEQHAEPVASSEAFEDRHSFDQLMALLRPDERAAVVLHYRHALAHTEIAEALALPLGTVKSLIRRARMKLLALHQASGDRP